MSVSRIFEMENLTQVHKCNIDITSRLRNASNLGSATIVVRFRNSEVPSFAPLLTIVNSQYPSSYFMLYTQNAYRVGLMRKTIREDGMRTEILNFYDEHQAQINLVNTLVCTIKENVEYCLYLNGVLLRTYRDPKACFLRDITALAPLRAALVGKTVESQKLEFDRSAFLGDIDFMHIYNGLLPRKKILAMSSQTIPDTAVRIPDNTFCSQPVQLYYPGYMGAPNYRMPSLLQTRQGTLLAAIDQRMHGPHEHPNKIHIVMRRSTDHGRSFGPGITVVQMPENAQAIDSCMLQDRDTGRIFLLTGQFSENTTLFSVSPGTGYEVIEGQLYRQLLDDNGLKYLENSAGEITCRGKPTPYTTNKGYELFFDGEPMGYLFSERCPLRVYPTSYLVYVYSDDDGKTWSLPQPLNPYVKENWMTFMGCSPGRGIQLRHGSHAGRLLFPVYYVNPYGIQCAALIYSDDHGSTWRRGESCNDHRLFDGMLHHSKTLTDRRLDTNEAQAVELPDGNVLLFAKSPFNETGCIAVAISRDGGKSFDSTLRFDLALHSTDSLSVISCGCKVDGYEALIYAGGDSVSGSCNGAVKIGILHGENPQAIEWRYSRLVKPGTFGHCSLSMISEDTVGLFYESSGGLDMSFLRMDIPFLMAEDLPLHPVELESFSCQEFNGGALCTLTFNQPVMICGDRRLKLQLSHRAMMALYHSRNENCKQYHFWARNTDARLVTGFSCSAGMKTFAVNGMCYIYSQKEKRFVWQYYTDEHSIFFSLFSSHIDTFDDSKRIVTHGEGWYSAPSSVNSRQESVSPAGIRCNSEQMVQNILRYVHLNYSLPLTLSEIAANLNINAAYLGRIFSKRVNQSFSNYLASYRIARARELLKDDGMMVYEIAQAVGYNDINHFYKVFQKHTHMNPTAFRKKLNAGEK